MLGEAARTLPAPYRQPGEPLGPAAATADVTILGRISLVDFLEPHACAIALVLQHGPERAPARIEHGLCHASLREGGGVNIPDEDRAVPLHQRGGTFVQEILPAMGDLRMQRPDTVLLAGALRGGELRFKFAVKLLWDHKTPP